MRAVSPAVYLYINVNTAYCYSEALRKRILFVACENTARMLQAATVGLWNYLLIMNPRKADELALLTHYKEFWF